MGLPAISYRNFLNEAGVTATARTQNSTYPASNILRPNVTHLYRSDSKCVVLNGTTKYFWIDDDAWNSYTGDFCFEFLYRPDTTDTSDTNKPIIDKWGVAGQRAYMVAHRNAHIRVFLSSNGTDAAAQVTFAAVLTAAQYDRSKLSYKAATRDLVLYVDGVESGRVIDTTATGTASITGAVPTSLHNGTTRLTIGADSAGANLIAGKLGFIGFDNAPSDNGGYLYSGTCDAYYKFDSSDGTDSSGNGRTLTAVSLSSGDYSNCTAYHWVGIAMSSALAPTWLMIDRRHNLSTGATVRVLNGSWFSSYSSKGYKASVTAGEAIVLTLTTGGSAAQWLEINDPANPDGYIEIPHVWLGHWQNLAGSYGDEGGYLRRAVVAGRGAMSTILTRVGSRIGPVLYEFELPWKFKDADRAIWEAAMAYAATDPMVLVLDRDNPDNAAYLVDWLGVHLGSMQGRGELVLRKRTDGGDDSLSETTMTFSECGAGVDQ